MRRLLPILLLAACTTAAPSAPPTPAPEVHGILLEEEASLLRLEDRREYDARIAQAWAANPNMLHRERIALALGRIGTADFEDANGNGQLDEGETMAGVSVLEKLASDPSPAVRRTVAFALGEIGDKRGVETLLRLAADPEHADVAAEAVEALAKSAADVTIARYRSFTGADQREAVRARAIRYLFRFDLDEASAIAAAAFEETDMEIRREAVYALSRRAYAPARARLELLLTDPDTLTRTYAARALGRIASSESYAALIAATADAHPWARTEIARAISAIAAKDPAVTSRDGVNSNVLRIIALVEDADPGTRAVAIETLGHYAKSHAVARQHLETLAANGTRWQRELSAIALAASFGADAIATLIDSSPVGTRRAILNSGEQGAAIRGRFAADPDVTLRAAAIGTVPDAATPADIDLLAAAIEDPDVGVRANAIDRLAAQATIPVVDRLKAALAVEESARGEANDDARLGAIGAIAALDYSQLTDSQKAALGAERGFSGPEPFLRNLLKDSDPVVRRAAAEALRQTFKLPRQKFTPLPVERPAAEYMQIAGWALGRHTATIHMPRGAIQLVLLPRDAPMTAWNFASLAQKGFFNGTSFMRVVPNFVVQAGDPRNDQTGGPGYAIRDEINLQKYTRGAVGMALAAPDGGGSQHFITHSAQPHLDGGYTIFARVSEGMEGVVDQIERGDTIDRITIDEPVQSKAPPGGSASR